MLVVNKSSVVIKLKDVTFENEKYLAFPQILRRLRK